MLDGQAVAAEVKERVRRRAAALVTKTGVVPRLAAILVGDDPASGIYVRGKQRACAEVGIASTVRNLPTQTSWEELREALDALGSDPAVHGILVQQPLPPQIDPARVAALTDPRKDVDGLHPISAGHLLRGECGPGGGEGFVPCTPLGIMEILRRYDLPIAGKHAVVIGRSTLVGKPIAQLLLGANATVTVCHSKTQDLASFTRRADILVVAIGRAAAVTPDMVAPGATVIDVGINRQGKRVVGDVDPRVAEVAGAMTPVPRGVGPMTIAMLLQNTVWAAEQQTPGGQAGHGG